jgi:hypothetical protein
MMGSYADAQIEFYRKVGTRQGGDGPAQRLIVFTRSRRHSRSRIGTLWFPYSSGSEWMFE